MKENRKSVSPSSFFILWPALVAPCFLFNPDWSIIDIMPDCIGYLLICLSMIKLRDLNSHFERASGLFIKEAGVSALKFAAMFFCMLLNYQERPTMILVMLLMFGVAELILIIPAWNAYFEGFEYQGFSYDDRRGKSYAGKTCRSTVLFFIVKQVITILPEISVLSEHKYTDDNEIKWYEYTDLFRLAAVAVLIVWGIVWLVKIYRFYKKTFRQETVLAGAMDYYRTNVVRRTGVFELRRIATVLILFTLGSLFICDVSIDSVSILPDAVCGALFILFFIFSRYSGKLRIPGIVLSSLYLVSSVLTELRYSDFRSRYSLVLVRVEPDSWNAFFAWIPWRFFTELLFMGLILIVLLTLRNIINNHCGYVPDEISEAYRKKRLKEINRTLNSRFAVFAVLAFISTAMAGASEYLQTFSSNMILSGMGLWTVAAQALCFVAALRLAFKIYDNASLRYMIK